MIIFAKSTASLRTRLSLLLLTAASGTAWAVERHVPSVDYPTIQAAIDASSAGDVVVVAPGTYRGEGNRNLDPGGKAITIRSTDPNDPNVVGATIIDSEGVSYTDPRRAFYFHNNEDANTVVAGLTMTNGKADYGGAVYCMGGSPLIVCCTMVNNAATEGGAVFIAGDPMIERCMIRNNRASSSGGGICCLIGAPMVVNCAVVGNSAKSSGGGVSCYYYYNYCTVTMIHCTIVGNTSDYYAGGIECGGSTVVTNSIVWGNLPTQILGGKWPPTVSYSDVQGGWTGVGNLDVDPCLALATDLHLMPGSACIDTGTPDPNGGLPTCDLDGNPRLRGNAPDMGAYEFNGQVASLAVSADALTFRYVVNGPNPPDQVIRLGNYGGQTLNWHVEDLPAWLEVQPVSGTLAGGQVAEVAVRVDTEGLSPEDYFWVLRLISDEAVNSPKEVRVSLHAKTLRRVPSAYATIQAAINASQNGDEVVIDPGTYTGSGNRDLDYGGRNITVRSSDPNNPAVVAVTVIDCEGGSPNEPHRAFYFHSGETVDAIVSGLTLVNGRADYGGAIYCEESSPLVTRCTIANNTAVEGGGLYSNGTVTINRCMIRNNQAFNRGGGVRCSSGMTTIASSVIINNFGRVAGGGVSGSYGTPTVIHCTIVGNASDGYGGGIEGGGNSIVANSIVWQNFPTQIQGTATVSYSDIQGGYSGTGNLDVDPVLASPNDPHIMPGSSCIDAGTSGPNQPVELLTNDLDGNPRPLGNAPDLGAYEFNDQAASMALSTERVNFKYFVGDSNPSDETIRLSNCGGAPLNWRVDSLPAWLHVQPDAGALPSGQITQVALQADPSGLPTGDYPGEFRLVAEGAVNAPRVIRVILQIKTRRHVPSQHATIQEAIDACEKGDEVIIAPGRYAGPGNHDLDYGGKEIAVRSTNPNDPEVVASTVIDCQGLTPDERHRAFYFHSGETDEAVVSGLTMVGGCAFPLLGDFPAKGGAILCNGSSPTIEYCVITNCRAGHTGGAITCYGSVTPRIMRCTLKKNYAYEDGGGISVESGAYPRIDGCLISDNQTSSNGGGIFSDNSSPRITNCVLLRNSSYEGGGFYSDYGIPKVMHCTIVGNHASSFGGGGADCDGYAHITNCIVRGNTTGQFFGSPLVSYCNVQGGRAGVGNIDVEPNYAFPDDYHLLPGSPCIDAGSANLSDGTILTDADGNRRPIGAAPDIGAYESDSNTPSIAVYPASLGFTIPADDANMPTRDLQIRNCGGGTLQWTVTSNLAGLSAEPNCGTSVGEVNLTRLRIDPNGLSEGDHTFALIVRDPASANKTRSVEIAVRVNVIRRVPSRYATIQAAIDACINGDVVVIAPGTYRGDGNRDIELRGKTIKVRGTDPNDPNVVDATVIDSEGSTSKFHRGFYLNLQYDPNTVIAGLTVTGGGAPTGESGPDGGAAYCVGTNVTFYRCVFTGNSAGSGGALAFYIGNPKVIQCKIVNNSAGYGSGGISCSSAVLQVSDCLISGNHHSAATVSNQRLSMTNCTIVNNTAGVMFNGERMSIVNSILWGNTGAQIGLYGGEASVSFSDIQGGWTGEGNLNIDPRFIEPNNYHLSLDSPCRDAGTNSPPDGLSPIDVDGDLRTRGARTDMGACELNDQLPIIASSPAAIAFRVQYGDPNQPEQEMTFWNAGKGLLTWSAQPDCPWLVVEPNSGTSMGPDDVRRVVVRLNPGGLIHGEQNGWILVTAPGVINSPHFIPVRTIASLTLRVPSQYGSLQAALDAAISYDEVVVADGTYKGGGNRNLDFKGKRINFHSENGPLRCVIDCEYRSRGIVFHSWETAEAIVDGFTILRGYGNGGAINTNKASPTILRCILTRGQSDDKGGAVCCEVGQPIFRECTLSASTAKYRGGGLYGSACDVTLDRCTIVNNRVLAQGATTPGIGGGVFLTGKCSPKLTHCAIAGNQGWYASGVCVYQATDYPAVLEDCLITGNMAYVGGGGLMAWTNAWLQGFGCRIVGNYVVSGSGVFSSVDSRLQLFSCDVLGNSAAGQGGGVVFDGCDQYTDSFLKNCTIVDNAGSTSMGGVLMRDSVAALENCILWSNVDGRTDPNQPSSQIELVSSTLAVNYSDVQGGSSSTLMDGTSTLQWGDGNIDADPNFVEGCAGTVTNEGIYDANTLQVTLTDTGANWAEGELVGKVVQPDAFGAIRIQFPIIANTAHTLTFWAHAQMIDAGSSMIPSGTPYQVKNYHLSLSSPCINAADPNGDYDNQTDVDGEPRWLGTQVDIGSDEKVVAQWRLFPDGKWTYCGEGIAGMLMITTIGLAVMCIRQRWIS